MIILLTLLAGLFEAVGIGLFYPVFQLLKEDGMVLQTTNDANSELRVLVDFFSALDIEPSLGVILSIVFFIFILRQIFMYVKTVYVARVHYGMEKSVQDNLFSKYLLAEIEYQDLLTIGSFSNIITREIRAAITGVMAPLVLATHLIALFILVSMLMFISYQMTLAVLLIFFLASQIPKKWIHESKTVGREIVKINTLITSFLVERLKLTKLIKLTNSAQIEGKTFKQLTNRQKDLNVLSSVLNCKVDVVMDPVVIAISLCFLYVSYTFANFSIETIGVYLIISLRMLPVVKSILSMWQKTKGAIGSIEIIQKRSKEIRCHRERFHGKELFSILKSDIEFRNVFYSYRNTERSALRNISIKINSGDVVALVGPSGGGKSTVIDLLPKLRIPESGEVLIDGINVNDYNTESLRNGISFVPQNPQLFSGKVREHICYGRKNISLNEIEEAARLSGAHEFIQKMPDGYESVIYEGAANLSGGQCQRLDIARAILTLPAVLILDEPTSNLDSDSEKNFKDSLKLIKDETKTTVIVIAHSLSVIRDVDCIFVVNDGEIEEQGNHYTLLKNNGWYAKALSKGHVE